MKTKIIILITILIMLLSASSFASDDDVVKVGLAYAGTGVTKADLGGISSLEGPAGRIVSFTSTSVSAHLYYGRESVSYAGGFSTFEEAKARYETLVSKGYNALISIPGGYNVHVLPSDGQTIDALVEVLTADLGSAVFASSKTPSVSLLLASSGTPKVLMPFPKQNQDITLLHKEYSLSREKAIEAM